MQRFGMKRSKQGGIDRKINVLKKIAIILVCFGIGTALSCLHVYAEEVVESPESSAVGNNDFSGVLETEDQISPSPLLETVTESAAEAEISVSLSERNLSGFVASTTECDEDSAEDQGTVGSVDSVRMEETTAENNRISEPDEAAQRANLTPEPDVAVQSTESEITAQSLAGFQDVNIGTDAMTNTGTDMEVCSDSVLRDSASETESEENSGEAMLQPLTVADGENTTVESPANDSDPDGGEAETRKQKLEQEYNPADAVNSGIRPQTYGAKGDNEADDTEAFNEAVSHLSAEQNTIYIPAGMYRLNVAKSFLLRSNTNFVMDKDAKLFVIPNGQQNYRLLCLNRISNVRIYGGQIYGDRYTHTGTAGEWGHGISVLDSSNIMINGVQVYDCWGDGIYLGTNTDDAVDSGCTNIVIQNCILSNNRRNDLSIVCADNVTVVNCVFNNANGTDPMTGIDIETNNDANPNEHIVIDNCSFDGNAKGSVWIVRAANDVQINNSRLNGTFVNFAGTNVTLSNTVVNGEADCRYGIKLTNGSKINDGGTADDQIVIDYHPSESDIYGTSDKESIVHKYNADTKNTIGIKSVRDDTYGTVLRFKRTNTGTHDAGIRLNLSDLTKGAFSRMVSGRKYRIEYTVRGCGNWAINSNQLGFYWINPDSLRFSTGMVTYKAGGAANGQIWFYSLDKEEDQWMDIGEIRLRDLEYTGISRQEDETYVYAKEGNIDTSRNGFFQNSSDNSWLYFDKGEQATDYCGTAKNGNELWYVTNGVRDAAYTGMAEDDRGWCYFTDGREDKYYTGFGTLAGTGTEEDGAWYYYRGRIAYRMTGAVKTDDGWAYVSDGRRQDYYSGLASGAGRSFLFKDGKVDVDYSGEASDNRGSWYIENGEVAHSINGMIKIGDLWRYVVGGKIDLNYTGVARNKDIETPGEWIYFSNGAPDDSFTGVAMAFGNRYYFKNGRLNNIYTGTASDGNNIWYISAGMPAVSTTGMVTSGNEVLYIRHGKVMTGFTGMALDSKSVWRYFENGKLVNDYTGIASNLNGWWYYSNGVIQRNYTGKAGDVRGIWYFVHGRIAYSITGIMKIDGCWRYIVRGRVLMDYTGTVKIGNMWYYFQNGDLVSQTV